MFVRFLVKKEKLSFRESFRRAPNLTVFRDGVEFASIEFGSLTLYRYQSEANSFVGRCGVQFEGPDLSKGWYLSIFERKTKRKVVEALATQPIHVNSGAAVINIENFEICQWSNGDGFTRIQRQDGEDVGFLRWGSGDADFYAKIDIECNLTSPEQDYFLILLLLFKKPPPWYTFSSSAAMQISVDYPGSE
jgi:hypothetical protein